MGSDRGAPGRSQADGGLEERRARNLRREVYAVASARARRYLENAVSDDHELAALLDDVRRRQLDPLTAVHEILGKVFRIDDEDEHRHSLTSRPPGNGSPGTSPDADHDVGDAERETGRRALLKAENLQRTGSFKIRGAVNCMATLTPEQRAAGVIAASAGNHGQAVAWAARELGMHATIFMPEDAPMAKVEPTLSYGGETCSTAPASTTRSRSPFARRGDRGDLRPRLRGRARDRRTGDDRARARRAGRGARNGADSGRRRRARLRDRDRAAGAPSPTSARRHRGQAGRVHDRRRNRRQGSGRADDGDPRAQLSTTSSRSTTSEISEAITLLLERSKLLVEGAGAVGVAALLAGKARRTGPAAR